MCRTTSSNELKQLFEYRVVPHQPMTSNKKNNFLVFVSLLVIVPREFPAEVCMTVPVTLPGGHKVANHYTVCQPH